MTSAVSFGPATVRVKAGDTVEWRNKSSFTHSVNADPARFPDDVVIPPGATPFDSGRIASGDVYRHHLEAHPHQPRQRLGVEDALGGEAVDEDDRQAAPADRHPDPVVVVEDDLVAGQPGDGHELVGLGRRAQGPLDRVAGVAGGPFEQQRDDVGQRLLGVTALAGSVLRHDLHDKSRPGLVRVPSA